MSEISTTPRTLEVAIGDSDVDFVLWEGELAGNLADAEGSDNLNETLAASELEAIVLEQGDEPEVAWVEGSPGGTTEAEYLQQSHWVIGQYGRIFDSIREKITTEADAEEWLTMKMTIAAAKSISDPYKLAAIRSEMVPVWEEYAKRMG